MLPPLSRRPVLVTGGAGFLGSHLCERLLDEGHHVVALDNLSSGSLDNVGPLLNHPRFVLLCRDVTAPIEITPSCIFNLACPASPPFYQRDPVKTTLTSVIGTWRMLELARTHRVPMLQASTSEVYGDPLVHPQSEDYRGHVSITGPRACYDEGKRCAETLCFDYLRKYATPVHVARIFNTYGPRMLPGDGRVVSNFIVQALREECITLYGDGRQSRSFCFVQDTIEGLVRLVSSAINGPVNLGNPHEISMRDLAGHILHLTGSRSRVVHRPLPEDDPRQRCPDISVARQHLGWWPRISLEEGLVRTIAHFREVLGNRAASLAAPG